DPVGLGTLRDGVDVVRHQPWMTCQDAVERLVHRPIQRIDRPVAVRLGFPLVIARGNDDRAPTSDVRPGVDRPSGEMKRVERIDAAAGRRGIGYSLPGTHRAL